MLPLPIDNPLLNLTPWLSNPLGEQISFVFMHFIGTFLVLWFLSKRFNLREQTYKTSLFISLITASVFFIIRSISIIFSLTDLQKPIVNGVSLIVDFVLLFLLIKFMYNLRWPKASLIFLITYIGKWLVATIITLVILFFFTTIPQDINTKNENFGTLQEIQTRVNFTIIEPSYIPNGYVFLNAQLIDSDTVNLAYQRKANGVRYGLNVRERLMETRPTKDYGPEEEVIDLSGEKRIVRRVNGSTIITWYSPEQKILFSVLTGVNGGLDDNELTRVARSLNEA